MKTSRRWNRLPGSTHRKGLLIVARWRARERRKLRTLADVLAAIDRCQSLKGGRDAAAF